MGPLRGTDKWEEQAERVRTVLTNADPAPHEVDQFLLLYVLDTSYARDAILEGERRWKESKRDNRS